MANARKRETAITTVLFSEHERAERLQDRRLSEETRRWWASQRLHGLCQAFRQKCEGRDLKYLSKRLTTSGGIVNLKRLLVAALSASNKPINVSAAQGIVRLCRLWLDGTEAVRPAFARRIVRSASTATYAVWNEFRVKGYTHPGAVRRPFCWSNLSRTSPPPA